MLTTILLTLVPSFAQTHSPPLLFEANGGRYGPDVAFVARARGQAVHLRAGGFDLALLPPPGHPEDSPALGLAFAYEGGAAASLRGAHPLPTRVHHFRGTDPAAWSTGNPTYAAVEVDDVWPGVDVRFYESGGDVEHDFVLEPGVDPGVVVLRVDGAGGLSIAPDGRLVVPTAHGPVHLSAPVVSQGTEPIEGRFRLVAEDRFGFELGAYDTGRELVIDPILEYATYVGGTGWDRPFDVVTDGDGASYVCGGTWSTDLPTSSGVLQPFLASHEDAFVAKLSPSGDQYEWITYFGGDDTSFSTQANDEARAVGLDSAGNVVLAGITQAKDLPVTPGAHKLQPGWIDGFVAKLSADGATVLAATYFGGFSAFGHDRVLGLALDADDRVHLTGQTDGFSFPASVGQTTYGGSSDGFVAVLSADLTTLEWATFHGGSGTDAGCDIELDALGRIYVSGITTSANLPTVGALQPGMRGSGDATLARFSSGGLLEYSTFVGSEGPLEGGFLEQGPGLAVEPSSGVAWLASWVSAPYPDVTPSAVDTTFVEDEGLVLAVDTDLAGAASLLHATYLGGSDPDMLFDAELDSEGDVWVAGASLSPDFPVLDAWQPCSKGSDEALLAELAPDGTLLQATLFGASNQESNLQQVRLDVSATDELTLVCRTASDDLATSGAADTTFGGGSILGQAPLDGYLARFTPQAAPSASASVRAACSGGAPTSSLVPVDPAPVLGSPFEVALGDPLGQSGLAPGVTLGVWAISKAPAIGYPCGLPLAGFGIGGGTTELLVSALPSDLVWFGSPEIWFGPGNPTQHVVSVPCNSALLGLPLYTQGYLTDGVSVVVTDGLDLVLGS